jgi:glycine cleavage system H protein
MAYRIDPQARYTETHEWVRVEGDVAVIGITDFAQHQLSDVVYVELPEVGEAIEAGARLGTFESVKAAADVYSPVGGEIVAANSALTEHPELVNTDPYAQGWLAKVTLRNREELDRLMDATTYAATLGEEG